MALLVPNGAEDIMLQYIVNKDTPEDLIIRLYSNDVTPSESDTVGTYTEVTGGGYAAITLVPANWTITPGTPTNGEHVQVTFSFTGGVGNVYGYYVTRQVGGELMWSERFSNAPFPINNNGDEIRITPRFTLE